METINSRVFMSGNSQAVRIPQRFKLKNDEVTITQTTDGALVIRPTAQDRGAQLLAVLEGFDDHFVTSIERDSEDQCSPQEREDLRGTCSTRTSSFTSLNVSHRA